MSKFCCKKDICCKDNCCKDNCCRNDCCIEMTDCLAKKVECVWRKCYCNAMLLPEIGIPSCACGVMTLTVDVGKCIPKIRINGLRTRSILARNAWYSAEVDNNQWVNLFSIVIPDVAGSCGCKSSGEIYTDALADMGISIDGNGYNWGGSRPHMLSIKSKAVGMNPIEFSEKQMKAIQCVIEFLRGC